jgi:hypothetical protein
MAEMLTELVERLQKAHRDKLVSVVLYGSGASEDHRDAFSDFNVLCVLSEVTPGDLARSEPIFRWWREMKNPSPLLLSEREVQESTDCFAMEFHDIKERRKVLFGRDVMENLEIDNCFYRAQVEHELRAKLLRLRQKAGGVLSDNELLLRLMLDSVSTFCVLFRHALLLSGDEAKYDKRAVVLCAQEKFGIDGGPFLALLSVREDKSRAKGLTPVSLFSDYLKQIEHVVNRVDAMEK